MKKIKIIFNGLGINKNNQAYVFIYDNYANLIYEGTTYNGYLNINLNTNKVYIVKAYFYSDFLYKVLYVKKDSNCFIFNFNHNIFRTNNNFIFHLTDFYYPNLPIERGELFLWQQ